MSVISTLEAVPNRIAIIYRFLQALEEPLEEDELRALLGPRALQRRAEDDETPATVVVNSIREAKTLGLVEEMEQGRVRVPPALRGMDDSALLRYLEATLVDPVRAEEAGQGHFPRALAWFLVQDPGRPLVFNDNQKTLVLEDGSDSSAYELTDAARFQQFAYWARYLGYAWRVQINEKSVVVPDPTRALEWHIREVLEDRTEALMRELLRLLAGHCPVLEGGTVRNEIEDRLPEEKRRLQGALSRSTSLALLRLQRRGFLVLDQRADAPGVILDSWPERIPVSHVILRERRGRR